MTYKKLYSTCSKAIIGLVVVANLAVPLFAEQVSEQFEFDLVQFRTLSLWVVLVLILPVFFGHVEEFEKYRAENRTHSKIWSGRVEAGVRQKASEVGGPCEILLNDTSLGGLKSLIRLSSASNFHCFLGVDFIEECGSSLEDYICKYALPLRALRYRGGMTKIVYRNESQRIEAVDFYIGNGNFFRVEIDPNSNASFESFSVPALDNTNVDDQLQFVLVRNTLKYFSKQSDSLFTGRAITLYDRDALFDAGSEIASLSQSTLHAIDFIPPEEWIETPIFSQYANAHKRARGKAVRIHIIDGIDKVLNDRKLYEDYAAFMKKYNITLKMMLRDDYLKLGFEPRGSLIIDDSVGVIAVNPELGAPQGEVAIDRTYLDPYIDRFAKLEPRSVQADEFLKSAFSQR